MLYIFFVETGTMRNFDIKLAMKTVGELKAAICNETGIPVDQQVMLISGGDSLDHDTAVSYYSAGTDTNPIFLFNLQGIEQALPPPCDPLPLPDYTFEQLRDEIEEAYYQAASLTALYQKCQIATKLAKEAAHVQKNCETMSFAHHLQNQGWAAVVANLEDMGKGFINNLKRFNEFYRQHLDMRSFYSSVIDNFNCDLEVYNQIPILDCLLGGEGTSISMLQWMRALEVHQDMKQSVDRCKVVLENLDGKKLEKLQEDINETLECYNRPAMKEMKGLNDRLSEIDKLLYKLKDEVKNQEIFAESMCQNYQRAHSSGETSVLNDLCHSHQLKLKEMLKIHSQLITVQERILNSKKEINHNLHQRLQWIVYVEKSIQDNSNLMVVFGESLRRLKCHLEGIQQIHNAPRVYLNALAEVVRRKNFAKTFHQWATVLSQNSQDIYNKEVEQRTDFHSRISKHFLKQLFPGIDDMPPEFALQPPVQFDLSLPNVRPEDLEALRERLPPDLASFLRVPLLDLPPLQSTVDSALGSEEVPSHVPPHKLQRIDTEESIDIVHSFSDASPVSDPEVGEGLGKKAELPKEPIIEEEEDKADSEEGEEFVEVEGGGDTAVPTAVVVVPKSPTAVQEMGVQEEFLTTDYFLDESMPSSITESNGTTPRGGTGSQSVKSHHVMVAQLQEDLADRNATISSLQESLGNTKAALQEAHRQLRQYREEAHVLRSQNDGLRTMVGQEMMQAYQDFSHLRNQISSSLQRYGQMQEASQNLVLQETREAEAIKYQQIQAELVAHHHVELDSLTTMSNNQMRQILEEKDQALEQLRQELKEREQELVQQAQREAEERCRAQHWYNLQECMRTVLVGLTGDSSVQLPVSESSTPSDLWNTFTSMIQASMTEAAEALREAREKNDDLKGHLQRSQWELEGQQKMVASIQEKLESQETMLKKYGLRISELTNSLSQARVEKEDMELALQRQQQSMFEPSTSSSLAIMSPTSVSDSVMMDESMQRCQDPKDLEIARLRERLSRPQCDKVSIISCNKGDVVMIFFEEKHQSHLIYLMGPVLHFLHTDCLELMGLKPEGPEQKRGWIIGEVVEKEYCQAKKCTNRYKVPVGTKFYRVKVKPWNREAALRRGTRREAMASSSATAEVRSASDMAASSSL